MDYRKRGITLSSLKESNKKNLAEEKYPNSKLCR